MDWSVRVQDDLMETNQYTRAAKGRLKAAKARARPATAGVTGQTSKASSASGAPKTMIVGASKVGGRIQVSVKKPAVQGRKRADVESGVEKKAQKVLAERYRLLDMFAKQNPDPTMLVEIIRSGIPSGAGDELAKQFNVPMKDFLKSVGINPRTAQRRSEHGEVFKPGEGERLMRAAEIRALAEQTLGSAEAAQIFLSEPNTALGGVTPLSLLDTAYGAEEVKRALNVINYGGVL